MIGLIGGIGSGKSAVAAILAERGGVVIDADWVGHRAFTEPEVRDQIVARFGDCVLDRQGRRSRRSRKLIGRLWVRSCLPIRKSGACSKRSCIPGCATQFQSEIERLTRQDEARVIVLDAAILFEAGWDDLCDRVVFVDAPRSVRRQRVAKQRGWSLAELRISRSGPMAMRHQAGPRGYRPWSTTQEWTT